MKRLQIMIDEDLDAALERRAMEERTSKAALIRRFVRERLEGPAPVRPDPVLAMIGVDDFEPADIDEVVYGA
jgi:hypothetical protein